MSEKCPRCGSLTTKKSISTYGCCAQCKKADEQIEKQRKKLEEQERKQNEVLIRRASGMVRRKTCNLNF